MVVSLEKPPVDLFDAYHTIGAIRILVILFKTVHKIQHFEIREMYSDSDDAGTATCVHESSRSSSGSRTKADGAIGTNANRGWSIRNGRRFECAYRKTRSPQANRIRPVKQISCTDNVIFE